MHAKSCYVPRATIALIFLCSPLLAAEDLAPELIDPFHAARWPATLPRQLAAEALPVTIDLNALRTLAPGEQIVFHPPAAPPITAAVEQIDHRSPLSWSLKGRLEGDADGFFILCVEDDAAAGLIQSTADGKLYQLSYVGAGVHEFAPVEAFTIPDCKTSGQAPAAISPPHKPSQPPTASAPRGGCEPPAPIGDVVIWYTPAARAAAGGTNAMNAQCQLAVDTANQTYVASLVTNRLKLVFRDEIAYTESGDVETDRNRLKGTSDGFMDFVHADRDFFGADFVSLFVESPDACGIAYCTPDGSDEGFCVVHRPCASSNFSFAHEIGHLQGCAHNREDAGSGCNEFCYSYGHRFFGNSGTGWRTVMSYDTDPSQFTRVGIWSNPDVSFDGRPCGVFNQCDGFPLQDRFNALTVAVTASDRELWRNSRYDVWVESGAPSPWRGTFADPYATVQDGVDAIIDGVVPLLQPELHMKAATYAESLTISKRMTITVCGGIARIGG